MTDPEAQGPKKKRKWYVAGSALVVATLALFANNISGTVQFFDHWWFQRGGRGH